MGLTLSTEIKYRYYHVMYRGGILSGRMGRECQINDSWLYSESDGMSSAPTITIGESAKLVCSEHGAYPFNAIFVCPYSFRRLAMN